MRSERNALNLCKGPSSLARIFCLIDEEPSADINFTSVAHALHACVTQTMDPTWPASWASLYTVYAIFQF